MPFPTTEKFIARAEGELRCKFPPEYRAWTLATNGGEVSTQDDDWQVFPVFDDTDRKRAVRSANHIVREVAQARTWHGFPTAGVAFASNGSGDLLVFLPREDRPDELHPEVHLWNHELRTCVLIASSFAELIDEA